MNLKLILAAVTVAGFAAPVFADGKALYLEKTCVACHGKDAKKPLTPEYPKLAGQNAKYIENALNAYKKGERSHPTMRGIAGSLTDQDIADLAAYYGTK